MDAVAVTGAANGIGLETALTAAARGARTVWLVDRDNEGLNAAASLFPTDCDVRLRPLDVSDRDAVAGLGDEWRAGSAPDLLVNSAGIRHIASLVNTTDDEWDDTIAVNLSGLFYMMRIAAVAMLHQGRGGVIVNIASVAAEVGFSERAAYCASKSGVLGLTRAAAVDLAASGIRVVAISPGFHRVGISKDAEESVISSQVPLGHSGDPRELAELIFDVARSSFVTGANIVVDGGALAGLHI